MATAKTTTKKKKVVTKATLITAYMDHVLNHGRQPTTIYTFCKDVKTTEANFYQHFGSFENLKMEIWNTFHINTVDMLNKDKNFEGYLNKDKMLSYFFTLFEILTANRSYVLHALDENKHMLKNLSQLKEMRLHLKSFATSLIEEANDKKKYKATKNPVSIYSEGAWVQFLFLLKYWMEDNSTAFEKTDVAIEKSVKAIFDIFETTPLESIIDFGKFLIKEKFVTNNA